MRIGCSIGSCLGAGSEIFSHSVRRDVGLLAPAGSRVGFLLCLTVTSHYFGSIVFTSTLYRGVSVCGSILYI